MRILILSGHVQGDAAAMARLARARGLERAAISDGHTALLIHPRGCRDILAEPFPDGAVETLGIDLDQLARREVIDGILSDWAPDALVALGLFAALAVGQLGAGPPCWIDLDDGPWSPDCRPQMAWGVDREVDLWHRLVWALDRADLLSCADPVACEALAAMLALRGRFAAFAERRSAPLLIADAGVDAGPCLEWLHRPARRPEAPRLMGLAEIIDATRAAEGLARVASLERRAVAARGHGDRRGGSRGSARREARCSGASRCTGSSLARPDERAPLVDRRPPARAPSRR